MKAAAALAAQVRPPPAGRVSSTSSLPIGPFPSNGYLFKMEVYEVRLAQTRTASASSKVACAVLRNGERVLCTDHQPETFPPRWTANVEFELRAAADRVTIQLIDQEAQTVAVTSRSAEELHAEEERGANMGSRWIALAVPRDDAAADSYGAVRVKISLDRPVPNIVTTGDVEDEVVVRLREQGKEHGGRHVFYNDLPQALDLTSLMARMSTGASLETALSAPSSASASPIPDVKPRRRAVSSAEKCKPSRKSKRTGALSEPLKAQSSAPSDAGKASQSAASGTSTPSPTGDVDVVKRKKKKKVPHSDGSLSDSAVSVRPRKASKKPSADKSEGSLADNASPGQALSDGSASVLSASASDAAALPSSSSRSLPLLSSENPEPRKKRAGSDARKREKGKRASSSPSSPSAPDLTTSSNSSATPPSPP